MRRPVVPTLEAVTSWLEVVAVVLLIAAAGVAGWQYVAPAAGLALSGVTALVASPLMSIAGGRRR